MVNFGYPYNDIVICKDSTDYLTFFYDSKNTNMASPPSSQSELSYEHTYK